MEMYGFARAGVAGEYSPTPVSIFLPTDAASNSSYTTILTDTVTIIEQGEILTLIGSLVSHQTTVGGNPRLRFSVDGVALLGAAKTVGIGGAYSNVRKVQIVDGLLPGPHAITVDWRNGGGASNIQPASFPAQSHAIVLCERDRVTSSREMDGFSQAGWPMIYTCGPTYQALSSTNTSTSTTVTTPLFTMLAPTRYAGSALFIRFSASAINNDNTGASLPVCVFQLFVDGVARCGTGNDTSQTAGGTANAGFVCVVPVQAGNHVLAVNWAGGASPGSTIDPSVDGQHALLSAQEVFCGDVESLPDAEGFSAYAFAAKNLPRVGYQSLQTDFTNGGGIVPLLQEFFYVSGENSAVSIEFTGSLQSNGVDPIMQILVDGVSIHGTTESSPNTGGGFTGIQCLSVEAAVNLCQGNHLIQVTMNGITTFSPVTNPTLSHANLVIREMAPLGP